MKVKIVANFSDETADYVHTDLVRPVYKDVPEHVARSWAANGWCIILPQEKTAEKEKPAAIEHAMIETPEDNAMSGREEATIKRRGRKPTGNS